MRIRKIKIDHWRHFENIELQIDADTGLVCIIGANGTGKSHLLELIAACAHQLGLAQGIEIPRGNPFADEHNFELQIYLAENVSTTLDNDIEQIPELNGWDRTITLLSQRTNNNHVIKINAGGIANDDQSMALARRIIQSLQNSQDVYFLSLDANRAYPKKNMNSNEVAQAYETDWAGAEYTRGRSFRPTTTLYDEWLKFFLAQENQSGTRLIQEIRRSREAGMEEPRFEDHFTDYKEALRKVLPHLTFTGINTKQRTLLFDTTGLELTFDQLSGGERELAFLIGQIDRFGLREGLFLLDEPELHLNSDLIRTWITYLNSTVRTGQIWLATHSLEAVEAAGQHATFLLTRNEVTRKVNTVKRLDDHPVFVALARAVGSPAFSLSQLKFVYIEGEAVLGERERFRKLAGMEPNIRFMEGGSCDDVLRHVDTIMTLATETDAGIRIGGIIDRDFLSDVEVQKLISEHKVFVLPVHEIENYFLHPETIQLLLKQHGHDSVSSLELIQKIADTRAGSWIFQQAMATSNAKSLPDIPTNAKKYVKSLSWQDFEENQNETIQSIVKLADYADTNQEKLKSILEIAAKSYKRRREENSLWKICEGKQVLNDIARHIGFKDAQALIQSTFVVWEDKGFEIFDELMAFRDYLKML